jgi:5-formyltetrahydrofolate cyclo-ligase
MPTPDTAVTDKIALRKAVRRQRMALTPTYRAQAMRAVARHASRLLRRGRRIGGYLAAGSELDVEILLSTLCSVVPAYGCRKFRPVAAACGSRA